MKPVLKFHPILMLVPVLTLTVGGTAADLSLANELFGTKLTDTKVSSEQVRQDASLRFRQGEHLFQQQNYRQALAQYKYALAAYHSIGLSEEVRQGEIKFKLAVILRVLGEYNSAEFNVRGALNIANHLSNQELIGEILNELGVIFYSRSEFSEALDFYSQALLIARQINRSNLEARVLDNIGVVHRRQGQAAHGLRLHQQAATILGEAAPSSAMALNLNNIGIAYEALGDYQQAFSYNKRALELSRHLGDQYVEARVLSSLGVIYNNLADYSTSRELYQASLAINQEIGNLAEAGRTLNNLGATYSNLGDYDKAQDYYEQALGLRRQLGDRMGESTSLSSLGLLAVNQGRYEEAIELYEEALSISRDINDSIGEVRALSGRAGLQTDQGRYAQALEDYAEVFTMQQQMQDLLGQSRTLTSQGGVYYLIGEFNQALEFYEQALQIQETLGDRAGLSSTLTNIGQIYSHQRQWQKAIEAYQRAFSIREAIGDRRGIANSLNNLGILYSQLDQLDDALNAFETVLRIRQEMGDRPGEAGSLNNLGLLYEYLERPDLALISYQQALTIFQAINDPAGARFPLINIGNLLAKREEIELAIIFYKQAVNITEEIRQGLSQLPQDLQTSYLDQVANTYRALADLLLQQDRILEAQEVLDLLRLQEIEDYLNPVRSPIDEWGDLVVLKPEQEIINQYQDLQVTAIHLGEELEQLRQIPTDERTTQQQQRISRLVQLQIELSQQFNEFSRSPNIQYWLDQLSREAQQQTIDLQDLSGLQTKLAELNAVLLYPLILEDRLELIITLPNPDSVPVRRTLPNVSRVAINAIILDFRQALTTPNSDANQPAQTLYDLLIRPIESDLLATGVETIIYAPDSQLRYIPIAALHDGEQWLIERYSINNITAKSLTEFTRQPQQNLRILAAAFADEGLIYSVPAIRGEVFSFQGLQFAGPEVETIGQGWDATVLLDLDFSLESILPRLNEYNIVHFATHAAFVAGNPSESFILFGSGESPNLHDIESWTMNTVDLVVLSACETGLGGLGNGEEILGIGYVFQNRGVRSVMASLWKVNDGGTQLLMNAFYTALSQGMTKAEALQQAQIALIHEDLTTSGIERGASIEIVSRRTGVPSSVINRLSHPYYWAPFILIGNGL